jgi:hypothetical protein
MKLLTVQLPPFSCYFMSLWSKYYNPGANHIKRQSQYVHPAILRPS